MSRYQKGKTNLDFTEARDSEWQWHQLGHMQVCISLQTDNHASTTPLKVFLAAVIFQDVDIGDTLSVDGDADAAVEARIRIGWNKFRQRMPWTIANGER